MRYDFSFADIISLVENEISRNATFATAEETHIKKLINMTHKEICRKVALKNLKKEAVLSSNAAYTTGTVAITNGSTAVTGSSTVWTSAMVNRKIRIGTDAAYYTVATFASATSITIDRNYTGTTVTAATYKIFELGIYLPRDFVPGKEKLVRWLEEVDAWGYKIWDDIILSDPALEDFGSPICYSLLPDFERREPASGNLTADTNTSTTSIVDAALSSTTDDYYNNWIVKAVSQTDTSEVTDYVGSTKTLTISPAITSLAVGSTYHLIDVRHLIVPWPLLETAEDIFIEYYRMPIHLVNNYDFPDIPEEAGAEQLLLNGACALYYGKDTLAAVYQARYTAGLADLNAWNNKFINQSERKEKYSRTNLSSREPFLRIPYQVPTS